MSFANRSLGTVLAFVGLAGCAGSAPIEAPKVDHASIALDKAAAQIQRSWNEVGQTQQGKARTVPTLDSYEGGGLPPGMEKTVRLERWAGPIESLVKELAAQSEYSFSVIGQRPAGVVVVFLDTNGYQKSIGYLLRDAGYQAGERCTIKVYAHTRTVELVYPSSGRG